MKKVFYFFIRHPYILLTMILIVILTIVLVVISVRRLYSGSLRVVVAPSTADVFVNNQLFKNGEYEGLRIVTVHVDIVSEGFESESFDLELLPDETAVIYRCLASDDDSLKQNDDYEAHCALVNEYYGEIEKNKFLRKFPISNDIPIVVEQYYDNYTIYISYRIDLGQYKGCKQEACLKITDISGGNYERALENIRSRGYDPDDYEIIYEDYSQKGHAG